MAVKDYTLLLKAFRAHLFAQVERSREYFVGENRRSELDVSRTAGYLIHESFLPTSETKVAIKTIEAIGRMQFDVVVTKGGGTTVAYAQAHLIASAFAADTDVAVSDGTFIQIVRSDRLPARDWDDTKMAYGVTMAWRYYATAST